MGSKNISLVASLYCLATVAATVDSAAIPILTEELFLFAPNGPGSLRTPAQVRQALTSRGAVEVISPRAISESQVVTRDHSGMFVGKVYTVGGWMAVCAQYIEEQFSGTDKSHSSLPVTSTGLSILTATVTQAIRSTTGTRQFTRDITGGWTITVELLQHKHEFNEIPYDFLNALISEALVAGAEFRLFTKNAMAFKLNDVDGHVLLQFQILPTIRSAVARFHDEP